MIPPKTQDKPDWNRRRFLRTAAGAAAALPTLRALGQQTSSTPLDITFYQVGDPHYRAFETTSGNHNSLVRTALRKMGELTASTPMPGAGTIGAAQAVLNVGDLLDSGTETNPTTGLSIGKLATLEGQWTNYTADFGLLGNEPNTLVKLPVYETYGNHDQDGFLKQICDRIAARAAQLPGITAKSGTYTYQGAYGNISITGVHYAWKMGPIHFVQTNLRVGDGPERLPSSGSYSFLKSYLEGQVGSSGAPVFVIVHLPPTTAAEEEWPKADRQRFYDLIRRFNVVGILVGHTHAYDFFDWRGPDNNGDVPIPVYQCDCLYKGSLQGMFNVFRIVGDALDPNKATVHMAQRMRNDVWGKSASRVISLAAAAPPPGPGPGAETGALKLLQWQSMNLHGLETYGLTIPQGEFVEPRQGGVQQLEMLFDRAITLVTATSLLSVSGVTAGGKRSLADCGLSVVATLDSTGKRVSVRFASTGPARLPDASKWRFTVNPAAIRGVDGSSLSASADTTRVISALVGDYNADGRVNALDLNEIGNTTAFDPEIVNCIRADINGDGVIDSSDVAAAWANRNQATTGLVLL